MTCTTVVVVIVVVVVVVVAAVPRWSPTSDLYNGVPVTALLASCLLWRGQRWDWLAR